MRFLSEEHKAIKSLDAFCWGMSLLTFHKGRRRSFPVMWMYFPDCIHTFSHMPGNPLSLDSKNNFLGVTPLIVSWKENFPLITVSFWMVVSRFPFSFNSRITVLSGTFVSSPCIRNSPSGTLGVEEQPANSPPVSRKQIVIIRPFILSVFSYTLCWRNNKAKTLIFTNTISPNSYAIFVKFLVICKQMVGNLINNQDNDCF